MTLPSSQREVVRAALGDDSAIPHDIVTAVEGDEQLAHLTDAYDSARHAASCSDARDHWQLQGEAFDLAIDRARELIDAAGYREELA